MGNVNERYENAQQAFRDAVNQYSGQNAWTLANKQSKELARNLAENVKQDVIEQGQNLGMNKGASMSLARDAYNKAYGQNMHNAFDKSLENSSNAITAKDALVNKESNFEYNKFKNTMQPALDVLNTASDVSDSIRAWLPGIKK